MDPYDLLGLPPRFDLSPAQVDRAFLARSMAVHPDRPGSDPGDVARSAELNAARAVLDDPEQRAAALLARLGGPSKESDRSLPPGYLQRVMDLREQVEADLADPVGRGRWEAWARERRAEHAARVADLFSSAGSPPDAARLRQIRVELNAWRYTERLIEQLDPGYDPSAADFGGTGGARGSRR